MPAIAASTAAERLATAIEAAKPPMLGEFYAELYPETPVPPHLRASELASRVRTELLPEEIVDLWNVVFPEHRNVWYNEATDEVYYSDESDEFAEYAD